MLRNFANPVTTEPLESAVRRINETRHSRPYVALIGLEVEYGGNRYTLTPTHNAVGFAPQIGEEIECSALGLGSRYRVVAVAEGYPGDMQVRR